MALVARIGSHHRSGPGDLGKDLRMNETEHALETSATHLRGLVEDLDALQLTRQAYPTKWTIADVLSHVGSGAVIMRRRIEAEVGHEPVPDGFNQSVWDEWNAKDPPAKAADALVADRQLFDLVAALTGEQRSEFHASLGPMSLDFTHFLGLRLSEHTLHTWDIEVVFDPTATLQDEATALVIDNLEVIGRFGGKPALSTLPMARRPLASNHFERSSVESEQLNPRRGHGRGCRRRAPGFG